MLHPTQRRAPTHLGIHTNRDVVRGVPSLRGTLQPQHLGFSGNMVVLPPELVLRRDVSARGGAASSVLPLRRDTPQGPLTPQSTPISPFKSLFRNSNRTPAATEPLRPAQRGSGRMGVALGGVSRVGGDVVTARRM